MYRTILYILPRPSRAPPALLHSSRPPHFPRLSHLHNPRRGGGEDHHGDADGKDLEAADATTERERFEYDVGQCDKREVPGSEGKGKSVLGVLLGLLGLLGLLERECNPTST